jgi:hypothetical protein
MKRTTVKNQNNMRKVTRLQDAKISQEMRTENGTKNQEN